MKFGLWQTACQDQRHAAAKEGPESIHMNSIEKSALCVYWSPRFSIMQIAAQHRQVTPIALTRERLANSLHSPHGAHIDRLFLSLDILAGMSYCDF
jgi:hypothetical protein